MNNVLNHLDSMFTQGLYSNVVRVCELTIAAFEQKPELTVHMKLQFHLYHADSLFNLEEYVQAESVYRQILQLKKYISKAKSTSKLPELQNDITNDVEIKYKVYLCCMKQKLKHNAIEVLESIQARLRNPKINMALANLYLESGLERPAITAYKEVLREAPLSLEAAENLLRLGVQGVEVNSLMLEAVNDITYLTMWLRGQAELHSRDYATAVSTFKSLDVSGLLKNNSILMVNIAYCYNFMCEDKKAIAYLQRALHTDQNLKTGRDLLATLLARSNDKDHHLYLEKLLTPTVDMSLWSSEQWVVYGNYMLVNKKFERALYFGAQACSINKRNVEAILLKANTLMQMGKYTEVIAHCIEAQSNCPYRFDIYKMLVECYIKQNRLREADTMASNACRQLNHSPQSLTLHAAVLMKDPMASNKVIRRLLEKAIASNPNYSAAVFLLAEQLDQEQMHEEACDLLLRHSETCPSSRIHQMLADNFARLQKDDDAFKHYHIALRLDPNNQRAAEGFNNIRRSVSASKRDSYYTSVGESSSYNSQGPSVSDHEPDPESDTDQWPNSNDFITFE